MVEILIKNVIGYPASSYDGQTVTRLWNPTLRAGRHTLRQLLVSVPSQN